ncbi:MAG: hypothetical protein ABGZ53_08790 [Fuerstiella sp.]
MKYVITFAAVLCYALCPSTHAADQPAFKSHLFEKGTLVYSDDFDAKLDRKRWELRTKSWEVKDGMLIGVPEWDSNQRLTPASSITADGFATPASVTSHGALGLCSIAAWSRPTQNAARPCGVATVSETLTYSDAAINPPYFDRRIRSVISPVFPYVIRHSLSVPKNGRPEQSGTEFELAAESARFGDASIERFSGWAKPLSFEVIFRVG